MRTTTHHGRDHKNGQIYSDKHNDRNYNVDNVDNVDGARSIDNVYWHCYGKQNMTFEEVEKKFYEDNFSEQLEKINNNYIKNRHPERVKTMEEWKKQRRYAPEEEERKIGDSAEHVSAKKLKEVDDIYSKKMEKWNNEHGNPFVILNKALHADETSPHIHERKVWIYKDENGNKNIGQEKALKQAGVKLPNSDKKEGKYNNRKITFDSMARQMWIETCRECGLELETEAIQGVRHNMEKFEMIQEKARMNKEYIATTDSVLQVKNEEYNQLDKSIKNKEQELKQLETQWQAKKQKEIEKEKKKAEKQIENYKKEQELKIKTEADKKINTIQNDTNFSQKYENFVRNQIYNEEKEKAIKEVAQLSDNEIIQEQAKIINTLKTIIQDLKEIIKNIYEKLRDKFIVTDQIYQKQEEIQDNFSNISEEEQQIEIERNQELNDLIDELEEEPEEEL